MFGKIVKVVLIIAVVSLIMIVMLVGCSNAQKRNFLRHMEKKRHLIRVAILTPIIRVVKRLKDLLERGAIR